MPSEGAPDDTGEVAAIAAGLSKAQRALVMALDSEWRLPRDLIPNGTAAQIAHRDYRLVERDTSGYSRRYLLTPLGVRVRAHLKVLVGEGDG